VRYFSVNFCVKKRFAVFPAFPAFQTFPTFFPGLFLVFVVLGGAGLVNALTNVTACGTLSSANEYYVLNTSLSSAVTCITIGADNVTLDCAYYGTTYNLTGTLAAGSYGVYLTGRLNASVKNCLITSFYRGVYATSSSDYGVYLNNTLSYNGYGFWLSSSSNNLLANNTLNYNGMGLYLSPSSNNLLVNNTLSYNGYGFWLSSSSNNTFTNNRADNAWFGFGLFSSSNNTLTNNTVSNNTCGFYLDSSSNNSLANNTVTKLGGQAGFHLDGSSYSDFQNYVDSTNTANGLPVRYYDGVQTPCPNDSVVSLGASYSFIGFLGCNNVTLTNTVAHDEIAFFYTTNSSVTNSNSSYSHYYGFYLYSSPNSVLANNTANNSVMGVYLSSSSNNSVISNNYIAGSQYAIYFHSSTANFTNNTLSKNSQDINIDPSATVNYSYNTALYSLNNYLINFSSSATTPAVDSLVSFNFTLTYANGTSLTSYSYALTSSPNETVNHSNSSNVIAGNFTPTRSGLYSLTLNLTDHLNNNFVRRYVFLVGATNNATAIYYLRSVLPSHGQPAGSDAKSLLFTAPTQEEYWKCGAWIQASPDEFIPVYGVVKNLSAFFWYKSGGSPTFGVQRFTDYQPTVDYSSSVPVSADYVSASKYFDVDWSLHYLFSWRWLSVKLSGSSPYWKTNATDYSTLNVTYAYSTTPVVRVESGYDDVQVLSATSPASDLTQAEIMVDGVSAAALNVLMPVAGVYDVYYDGVYCSAAYTSDCSFTQDNHGNLSVSVALGSTHNVSVCAAGMFSFSGFNAVASGTDAVVSFSTSEQATDWIVYSLYPNFTGAVNTSVNATLSTSHSVVLTGLAPGTVYYYFACGTNASGSRACSSMQSFSTQANQGGGGGASPTPAATATPTPAPTATPTPSSTPVVSLTPIPSVESTVEPTVEPSVGASVAPTLVGGEPTLTPGERNNIEGASKVSESIGNVSSCNSTVCRAGEGTKVILRRTIEVIQTPNGVLTRVTLRVSNEGKATAFGVSVSEFVDLLSKGGKVEYSSLPERFFEGGVEWVIDVLPPGASQDFSYGVFRQVTQAELAASRAPVVLVRSVETVSAELDYSLLYAALLVLVSAGAVHWFYSRSRKRGY